MAYRRSEDLGAYGERRVFGVFTMTNVVGALVGALMAWNGAGLLGLPEPGFDGATVLRALLCLGGAVGGGMATIRWTGVSLWDRAVLWAMFQLRRQQGKTRLRPQLTATAIRGQVRAPLVRDGQRLAEVYDPAGEGFHGAA
ncbi:hypothetical protein F8S13_22565 [Chloroflexia bacterium SDU3-3]|nr:hypothetical protein F8S13_22565 [Chloroflexia bacterium SDU3-3]